MDSVHIAVVSHRHGMNVYAATTKERLEKQVADYCRNSWDDFVEEDQEPPKKDADVIDVYFKEAMEHMHKGEYLEWCENIPVD